MTSWRKNKTHCLRGHEYDEENIYWAPNGLNKYRQCKKCRNINLINWRKENYLKYEEQRKIAEIRAKPLAKRRRLMHFYQAIEYLGGKCVDCNYYQNLDALQFDHVPDKGKKSFNIARILGRSWNTIQKELDKWQLRCANCHAIITKERQYAN